MGSNVQVVWEKFCRYFDVEPVYLPMEPGATCHARTGDGAVDENTIGVVAIFGTTYTGELEPVKETRRPSKPSRRAAGPTSRCTSTRPAADSSSPS